MRLHPFVALLVCSAAELVAAAEDALTNADIVALTEAGLSASVIVAKIESSATEFDTSVEGLVALAGAGVADTVVAAMVASGHRRGGADTGRAEGGPDPQGGRLAGCRHCDPQRSSSASDCRKYVPGAPALRG